MKYLILIASLVTFAFCLKNSIEVSKSLKPKQRVCLAKSIVFNTVYIILFEIYLYYDKLI